VSRFIARRGKPQKLYSDNGSNFQGALVELRSTLSDNNDFVSKFADEKQFSWHFHPPHGSHHGGHYERMIKSVRKVLHGLTNEQEMTEDNLLTFLCEAEKILNDRPVTSVSNDPNDPSPLSPSLILLLRGNPCERLYNSENSVKRSHRQAQFLADIFWKRWLKEYISSLQVRQKWLSEKRNLKVGDLVFMTDEGHARGRWPIGRVVEVYQDVDGNVRSVKLKDKSGFKIRPISKLALLEAVD
jgi:hypothetical protein